MNPFQPLPLPNGEDAKRLRLPALYERLTAIGVPGINGAMNKDELLRAYDAALQSKVEAIVRLRNPASPNIVTLQQAATALAAANGFGLPELQAIDLKPPSIFDP